MPFSFLIIVSSLFCVLFWAVSKTRRSTLVPSPIDKESIQNLDHQKLLQKSSLEERAAPNHRLVRVFGIENAFTTTDKEYYKQFVTDVRLKLSTSGDEWIALGDTARKDVGRFLHELENDTSRINLVKFVQIIVFRAVMLKFFPDHATPADEDIKTITSLINSLWIESKHETDFTSISVLEDKIKLTSKLRHIFGKAQTGSLDGRENPLNILLPAYETLWRIVLRLFLEVRYRSTKADFLQYIYLFKAFLTRPDHVFDSDPLLYPGAESKDSVGNAQYPGHLSMKDIVNEGLRLYPPTRRIYRQIKIDKVAVDVEAIHRDPSLWGEDSLKFRPERFSGVRRTASSFLPFGMGVFECPAKRSFGPFMIGVLVAALTMEIGKDYALDGNGLNEVEDMKEPLGNGRNTLEDLWIVAVESE